MRHQAKAERGTFQFVAQTGYDFEQYARLRFRCLRLHKTKSQGQTGGGRRAKLCRTDKGEQLQHIEMAGFPVLAIAEQAGTDQGGIGDDQRFAAPQLAYLIG